jgi:hypothetical protein
MGLHGMLRGQLYLLEELVIQVVEVKLRDVELVQVEVSAEV